MIDDVARDAAVAWETELTMAMRGAAAARSRARRSAEEAIGVVDELDRHLQALAALRKSVRRAAGIEGKEISVRFAPGLRARLSSVGDPVDAEVV